MPLRTEMRSCQLALNKLVQLYLVYQSLETMHRVI